MASIGSASSTPDVARIGSGSKTHDVAGIGSSAKTLGGTSAICAARYLAVPRALRRVSTTLLDLENFSDSPDELEELMMNTVSLKMPTPLPLDS